MATEEQAASSGNSAPGRPAEGLEELVLELSAPRMEAVDGIRRATAQARLLRSVVEDYERRFGKLRLSRS